MENVQEKSPIKVASLRTVKVVGALAATSFLAIKCGMIETFTREPLDLYPDITDCTATSESRIDEVNAKLQDAAANIPNEDSTPEDYGLSTLAPDVTDEIYAIEEPEQAIEYANSLTTELYGFPTTTEKPNDPQTLEDAQGFITSLSRLPIELVSVANISEVRLNADLPDIHAANYSVSEEIISLGPESPQSFGHEAGHAFAKHWAEENCDYATVNIDPNFETINPEGFQYNEDYDGSNELIEDATVVPYGGTAVEEDVATIFDELTSTRSDLITCPYYEETEIVKEKFAITIARMEEAAPGVGNFYIANLTERVCPVPLIDTE